MFSTTSSVVTCCTVSHTRHLNKGKVKSVYEPVSHKAVAYPEFLSRERLGVFLSPSSGWDASPSQAPSIKFACTHSTPG